MKMEWQPIETTPKDGTPLILFSAYPNDEEGNVKGGLIWVSGGWTDAGNWRNSFRKEEPTHWLPLPLPPTVKGEK